MLLKKRSESPGGSGDEPPSGPEVLHDKQNVIPLSKILTNGDIILLLTPVVPPAKTSEGDATDPFEPLGRSIARRHPWTRHVPYTPRGITSTHVGFIKAAKAVVFVVTGLPGPGQSSQVEVAEIARQVGDQCRHIIIACCNVSKLPQLRELFPTVLQLPGFAVPDLEAAAALLFGDIKPSVARPVPVREIEHWPVQVWDAPRDMLAIHELWCQNLPASFRLDRITLQMLLRRDGYSMHYVVRGGKSGSELLGFCATYTTYADNDGEKLIGSLAVIIVKAEYRRRGIGTTLHQYALSQLTRLRGVTYVQLGTTYPRLLFGVPAGLPSTAWFRRRGWDIKDDDSSTEARDWVLDLDDWPRNLAEEAARLPGQNAIEFRACKQEELDAVLSMIIEESGKKGHFGWWDQYMKLTQTIFVEEIMIGKAGDAVIAAAITYTRPTGSPAQEDLPWATTIGYDVGGATCICIAGKA